MKPKHLAKCGLAFVTAVFCLLPPQFAAAQASHQAWAFVHGPSGRSLTKTTGHPLLDHKLNAEASQLAAAFSVMPDLFFFNDSEWPNAYASAESTAPGLTGTVYLGQRLLDLVLADPTMGEPGLTMIMAHEWGHITQVALGFPDRMNGSLRELHADLLAGWYIGRRSLVPAGVVPALAVRVFQRGDDGLRHTIGYGTPRQRLAATRFGFRHAHLPLDAIYQEGLRFVGRAR